MNQTTAFMGGCVFTIMAALLLLIGWLLFGDLPSSDPNSAGSSNQPSGVFPLNPTQPNQPYGAIPISPINPTLPNQPFGSITLPPPPPLSSSPSPSDSSNSDSKLENRLDQQQTTTQQLTTQLERQRMQIEQLTTQVERQRMQIEQLSSQGDQQRIRGEQLMMQLQEQQRMMSWTANPARPFQPQVGNSNLQTAVLWVLVGIVLALFLGGSIFILSLVFLLTQPQRRSSSKRYPMQPINFAWPYEFYDDQTELLPPPLKTRRNR